MEKRKTFKERSILLAGTKVYHKQYGAGLIMDSYWHWGYDVWIKFEKEKGMMLIPNDRLLKKFTKKHQVKVAINKYLCYLYEVFKKK